MAERELFDFWRASSTLFGLISFVCWSLSFYPQPLLNQKRKSIVGWNVDFPFLNVLGFAAYTVNTAVMLWSPAIREQYAYRYPASPEPSTRWNDFAFAAHALVLCVVTYSQVWPRIWGFEKGEDQKVTKPGWWIFGICLAAVAASVVAVLTLSPDGGYDPSGWAWIDVVSFLAIGVLGDDKMVITFYKYMPQALDNFKRKATTGFSIWQILLDLTGGVANIGQLLIDCSLEADWSGLTGNPVKVGLSVITLFFDVIFVLQHYVLYPDSGDLKSSSSSCTPGEEGRSV
ncbi:L-cystine transporter-like protein [Saccharata proteae CBS 121410]|uniref:L-cystine transporter-like protein n=1 Tax=Saccharata proteae CBS 121410 TaxID=1314787 RepID=A0A9P4LVQ7_9PEZI|nr:L-cystine transporter-like protein [Saccharata proteae CBS 121410]